jgi:hypothetical protein
VTRRGGERLDSLDREIGTLQGIFLALGAIATPVLAWLGIRCVRVSHPLRPCDRVGHAATRACRLAGSKWRMAGSVASRCGGPARCSIRWAKSPKNPANQKREPEAAYA